MSGGALATEAVAKVWGRDVLPEPFAAPPGERIGEIWFETPSALEGLLAKYLFTSEKLSVQVHPSDAQAPEGKRGKEECWLILDAEPDATIALGFKREVGADEMRTAAEDGSIERLLDWKRVAAGDFFYLPAGTVHAIGPGLALVEVQQESDITYRLYDYGRPRELHLEEAMRVAHGEPYPETLRRRVDPRASAMLVDGPHFLLAHVAGDDSAAIAGCFEGAVQLLPLEGGVAIDGETIGPGRSGWAESLGAVGFSRDGRCLVAAPLRPKH